mgnify:FL=1
MIKKSHGNQKNITKTSVTKKIPETRSLKTFEKIRKRIDLEKLEISLGKPDDLNRLILNVNKFMVQRLQTNTDEEIIAWWLKTMKRYRVLISIMNAYRQNEFSTYKEIIIKELRIYSYKTISNIIDDALEKKYIKYVKNKSIDEKKIKRLIPSSHLVSAFLNWNIRNIKGFNETMKMF